MHADPILPRLVASAFVIVLIGVALRRLHQPHVVGYLVAGVLLGPHGLSLWTDVEALSRLGDLGIVLLLFFVGIEMSLERLVANWRVAVIGTTMQIATSLAVVWALGAWLDWPLPRVLLIGFVVSLSSTAVVVSMLSEWGHIDTEVGHDAMGILIVQDLALVPMLIVLAAFGSGGDAVSNSGWILQIVGGVVVLAFGAWVLRRERISLPLSAQIGDDREMQVFAAALICFGLALATAVFHLSTALGAFLAGIVVASSDATEWVAESLHSFRVILLALFFVSIGLLMDVSFLGKNVVIIGIVVLAVLLTNTVANALIVRAFGRTWRRSLFIGALLAQAGEFGFVLAAVGQESGIITMYGYQLTISVIFATLALSPVWVRPFRAFAQAEPLRPHSP